MEASLKPRERRRKQADKNAKCLPTEEIKNVEYQTDARVSQSSYQLFRRDTYVLCKTKSDTKITFSKSGNDELNVSSIESMFVKDNSNSDEENILTYNVNKESTCDTYSIDKPKDLKENRPVPAPRKQKVSDLAEKQSSDTDKDVAEIDLDEVRVKSDTALKSPESKHTSIQIFSPSSGQSSVTPVPKPRKRKTLVKDIETPKEEAEDISKPIGEKIEEDVKKINVIVKKIDETTKIKTKYKDVSETQTNHEEIEEKENIPPNDTKDKELPLVENLHHEYVFKSENVLKQKLKKDKKLKIADLMEKKARKKKSTKKLSSVMKLEKSKMPKISFITKEKKEMDTKKDDDDNMDFHLDSPEYPRSVENGRIYVQNKNGFYLMRREDVLRKDGGREKGNVNKREMEEMTVKTAILFQKYWSRMMMFFHGLLAGFAFGHAATVTAMIFYYNYDPKPFIHIYSNISLKIHFIFYSLTTLCIVSCFDRVDIGHINRKHWETAWRVPSVWSVLCVYIASYILTFTNQKIETKFDAYQYGYDNNTDLLVWNTRVQNEIQLSVVMWFHIVWARDILLIVAWFIISLTKFSDFLCGHLNNMIKYANVTIEERE